MADVALTYYLEIYSSWCSLAEPAWTELKRRYPGRVDFSWKIALMNPEDFPDSREECDWYYRRCGTVTRQPAMFDSGWVENGDRAVYRIPNLVAEAGRDLECDDDRIRLALTRAALKDGRRIANWTTAVGIAAKAGRIDARKLGRAARSAKVRHRVEESTAEFHGHRIDQRPGFIVTDAIGDKAVFSGLVPIEPVAAAIDAMLHDCAAYTSFAAHFGPSP